MGVGAKGMAIKSMIFQTGFISTENDLFAVSSFKISIHNKSEVRCYLNCLPEEKEHIKKELLDKQASIIFIGPKFDSLYETNHDIMAFTRIHNMHFIDCANGLFVVFNHDSGGRRFLYNDNLEYVYQPFRKL